MSVRKIKDDSGLLLIFKSWKWIWSKLKGGYDHFMKEIYEQPSVIKDTYRGRLHANEGLIQMSGVEDNQRNS
jgi:glucosamine--fructose-6-phosphate aminotransferase (isomerizing)